jgi:hypothetical protein
VRVADAERIARAGGEPAVELVLGLLAEVTALRERVDEHERLLKQDSRNSSKAPSNDPPLTRQQRRARERERAKQQGRKQRGAQPGLRARRASWSRRSALMVTSSMSP